MGMRIFTFITDKAEFKNSLGLKLKWLSWYLPLHLDSENHLRVVMGFHNRLLARYIGNCGQEREATPGKVVYTLEKWVSASCHLENHANLSFTHIKECAKWEKEKWNHFPSPVRPLRRKPFLLHGTARVGEKGSMALMTHKMRLILYRKGHHWVRKHRPFNATCCRWAIVPCLACL